MVSFPPLKSNLTSIVGAISGFGIPGSNDALGILIYNEANSNVIKTASVTGSGVFTKLNNIQLAVDRKANTILCENFS